MSTLSLKNVKIQDPTGTLVSTLSYDGTNVTIDKSIVATAPTAPAGTSNNQLATTAFAYGASSKSTNGYQKLPSGLIIQWGTYSYTGNGAAYQYGTLNFNISFPNVCVAAIITGSTIYTGASLNTGGPVSVYATDSYTASNFRWRTDTNVNSNFSGTQVFSWVAIGY
jgi:hypothetical protein